VVTLSDGSPPGPLMTVTGERTIRVDSMMQARIDSMLKRDIAVGVFFASAMWLTLLFVYLVTARVVEDRPVALVMLAAALALGVLNTLSLMSLISRYRNERAYVYGEDITHLDAMKAAQDRDKEAGAAR
jgi:hypothetical protein